MLRHGGTALPCFDLGYRSGQLVHDGQPRAPAANGAMRKLTPVMKLPITVDIGQYRSGNPAVTF